MGQPRKFNERAKAIEWFATPSDKRVPLTQEEMEKELKLSEGRLSKWLWEPDFIKAIQDRAREQAKSSHTSDIISATVKEAKGGNQQAVTNYFKYIEQIAEKSEHKITGKVSDILDSD